MEFFKQFRVYMLAFIVLGFWTSLPPNTYNLLLQMYSFFVLLFVFSLIFLTIYFENLYSLTTISNTVANSLCVLIVFVLMFIVIESILQSAAQTKLIEKFTLVDELFQSKINISIPYQKEKSNFRIKMNVILLIFLPIYIFAIGYFYYFGNSKFLFQSSFAFVLVRLRPIQIQFFICLLENRLRLINEQLKKIAKHTNESMNCLGYEENSSSNTFVCSSSSLRIYDTLLNLKQIYSELYNICDLINATFGFSLLTILIESFVDFTATCYWLYFSGKLYETIAFFIILLIPKVAPFGVLCFCGSSCYQQVSFRLNLFESCEWLIFKIVNFLKGVMVEKNLHRILLDKNRTSENDLIREFSLQVHHERFITSACGFLNVNLNLFGSV